MVSLSWMVFSVRLCMLKWLFLIFRLVMVICYGMVGLGEVLVLFVVSGCS